MPVDWLNFKSCLGDSGIVTVFYVDDEGSEIPVESECEFEEALKVAKLNNKHLKLILHCKKPNIHKTVLENQCELPDIFSDAPLKVTKKTATMDSAISKENKCHCGGDSPPEWFTHYMKKFKKEILHELKSSLCDALHSAVEKEKKLSKIKGDTIDLLYGRSDPNVTAVTIQSKKKKKGSDKDLGGLSEQREVKFAKKIDKLHPAKFERLEKFDSKTRVLLEEKRRLLERKRHSKPRFEKHSGIPLEKEILKKSASFHKSEVCVFLPPNAEFVVTLNFTNDGTLSWEAPWLECFDFNGLYPKEARISLPRLLPMESGFTTLRGRVSESGGLHHFKCRLFDGLERFGPEFTCWAKVEVNDCVKKLPNAIASSQESGERMTQDSVGVLIDFEKDDFTTTTRKKITENINEVERRLQGIDFVKPLKHLSAAAENIRQNVVDLKMPEGFHSSGSDLCKNLEGKEKNWKEKMEQDGVYFGVDCLHLATPEKTNRQKDENERSVEFQKVETNNGPESSSDSELSIILLSDEENFIVVPLTSEIASPAESVSEDKNLKSDSEERAELIEQQPLEPHKNDVEESNKEVLNCQWQLGHTKSRRPPFAEDVSKSKPKKIKPSSTEYNFTAVNLTQPTFTQTPNRLLEERPAKFTFTGEREEKKCSADCTSEEKCAKHTASEEKEEKSSLPEGIFERRPWRHISSEEKGEKSSLPEGIFERRPWRHISSEEKGEKSSLPEGIFERRWWRHISSEEKEEKSSLPEEEGQANSSADFILEEDRIQNTVSQCLFDGRPSNSAPTQSKEEKSEMKKVFKRNRVATEDASGKIIYAVSSNGYCLPVEYLLEGQDHCGFSKDKRNERRKETETSQRGEKRCDRFSEDSAVNILPSSLLNGPPNVMAVAFNTARSVLNNLHSALTGRADPRRPANKNREEDSTTAMLKLLEMGFENTELNKSLLLIHENNLTRVVEDLILMQ